MPETKLSLEQTLAELEKLLSQVNDPVKDKWDPIALGLLLARLEYEHLNVDHEISNFSNLVKTIVEKFPKDVALKEKTAYLLTSFTEVLGFKGDTNNYYNVKNSFLNDVFVRRKGIPISLSLVFMGIAYRAGMNAVGISFPGHFLVRMIPQNLQEEQEVEATGPWYVDTFEEGKILSLDDCQERLNSWTRGMIPFSPDVLKTAHPRDIVSRMLRNLRAIYQEKEDLPRMYWVLTSLIELCPADRLEALKERGFLFARMGRFRAAIEDLRNYMRTNNSNQNMDHIEKMLRYFELQKELTN